MTGLFFDVDDTLYSRRALLLRAARETAERPSEIFGEEGSEREDLFMNLFYKHGDENYPLVVSGQITPLESNVWRYVQTLQKLGEKVDEENGESFARRYNYLRQHMEMSDLLRDTLRELSSRPDLRLGVITNGPSELQWKKVAYLGADAIIDQADIIVSGDLGISKPEAGIFLEGERRFGLRPENLWMVGDSVRHDIQGAKALGWHTLWIRRNDKDSSEADADITVDSEKELCEILRNM